MKAQKGNENKLLKGLVMGHAAECNYSKHTYVNLRENIEIKMLLKFVKRSRAAFNKE